jgi:hypothetical protein
MSMDHQSVFKDVVPHLGFQVFYIVSVINFFNFSNFMNDKARLPGWSWNFTLISIVSALAFWCYIFFKHNVTNYVLYWLPLANVGGWGLAMYVEKEESNSRSSLESLKQSRYTFNKP